MNYPQLKNKVCWITGASSGIGAALALRLNQWEAQVIVSSRNPEQLQALKDRCAHPERIHIVPCDLEVLSTLPEMTSLAWNAFGSIDYVFLNAGIAVRDMVEKTDLTLIRKVMDINFLSNVVISKSLLPLMLERGGGHFVVTSSLSGKFGIPKLSAYAASKHALHGFYESLRAEYGNQGLRVTMAIVGLVRTNITLNALQGDGSVYGKMHESVANGITPDKCAQGIIRGAVKGRREVLVGGVEKYSVIVKRLFPGLHATLIARHSVRRLRNAGLAVKVFFQRMFFIRKPERTV